MLLIRRSWVANTFSILLVFGALVWGTTTHTIYKARALMGKPWLRMALILGSVAAFTAASALVFQTKAMKKRYRLGEKSAAPGMAAFFLTAIVLWIVQTRIFPQDILLDRFIEGGGWLEGFWLSVFAGYMADKMYDARKSGE
jgi:fluoride ion exporter CrcB/FEX